jgi:methylated-DNA-protein-cysteine methyltransferase-like protein
MYKKFGAGGKFQTRELASFPAEFETLIMSDFYDKVYEVVRMIPPGKVTSYGAIASYLGTAQSSRMVGWAMNNAHVQERYVPAHRVVNRNGLLTGKHHFGSLTIMQELLEAEGIQVIDDQIIDFAKHFWNPRLELAID